MEARRQTETVPNVPERGGGRREGRREGGRERGMGGGGVPAGDFPDSTN